MDPFAGIFFTDNNFNSWSHSISKALEVMKMMKRTPWKQQNAAEFAHFVKTDTKKKQKEWGKDWKSWRERWNELRELRFFFLPCHLHFEIRTFWAFEKWDWQWIQFSPEASTQYHQTHVHNLFCWPHQDPDDLPPVTKCPENGSQVILPLLIFSFQLGELKSWRFFVEDLRGKLFWRKPACFFRSNLWCFCWKLQWVVGRKFRQNRRWEDWLDVRDLPLVTKCPAMASARYRHWGCLGFSLVGFFNTAFCRGMYNWRCGFKYVFNFHTYC